MKTVAKTDNGSVSQPAAGAKAQNVENAYVSPEVNIFETPEGYVLQAEMPGVPKDGIEVTLEGNAITLVGHRGDANPNGAALYRESSRTDFRRVFELDPEVDTGRIGAQMTQGVLTVTLPKAERVKPRKIEIQ